MQKVHAVGQARPDLEDRKRQEPVDGAPVAVVAGVDQPGEGEAPKRSVQSVEEGVGGVLVDADYAVVVEVEGDARDEDEAPDYQVGDLEEVQ
jgi:hypothetical protein